MINLPYYDLDEALTMKFSLLSRGYEEYQGFAEVPVGQFEEWTGETENGDFACGFYIEPLENDTFFMSEDI